LREIVSQKQVVESVVNTGPEMLEVQSFFRHDSDPPQATFQALTLP